MKYEKEAAQQGGEHVRSSHKYEVGNEQEATSNVASPEMASRIQWPPEQAFSNQQVLSADEEGAEGNEDQRQVSKYVPEAKDDQSRPYSQPIVSGIADIWDLGEVIDRTVAAGMLSRSGLRGPTRGGECGGSLGSLIRVGLRTRRRATRTT